MTRVEIIKLLEFIKGAYPNAKITDPVSMVNAWELCFGEYDAADVYKAARMHLVTNKFFPTPADLFTCMGKAKIIYNEQPKTMEARKEVLSLPPSSENVEDIIETLFESDNTDT